MKQKKHNRFLAAFLAVAMMLQVLPMLAFAAEDMPLTKGKAKIGNTVYDTVLEAVTAAGTGDTIELGEGNYTLYSISSVGTTKGKDLTFVGQGTDKTAWNIGALVPDPANFGTEYNSDYSFDGAGTVTFKNMTLRASNADYLGFVRATNTVVDNCVINGKTFYWGYTSAEFKDTTFNAPSGDYALWTYSSPVMTFDGCTFNASGKVINVYTDYGAGKNDITVNFENCTVNHISGSLNKTALNINDSNMGNYKYIINISGSNHVTAERDTTTCTQLFGFGGKINELFKNSNSGRTEVNIDGKRVWENGKMQTHAYTDGEKEQNFTRDEGDWTDKGDHYERKVTKTCNYCGYKTTITQTGYKLEYDLNGGDPAEGADYTEKIVPKNEKVTLAAAPTMPGYFFHYWDGTEGNFYGDLATIKMTANTKLTAQWGEEPPEVPDTPEGPGCCGISPVIIAAGTTVIGYYAGTQVLKHCFGLPYWPGNRKVLALMLWEDADRPMPESTLLYPDIGQEEEDMDLQHAARWAMENELLPDLNWDSSKPEEEQKFFPNYAVSRAWALHAWNKAQQLKQDA